MKERGNKRIDAERKEAVVSKQDVTQLVSKQDVTQHQEKGRKKKKKFKPERKQHYGCARTNEKRETRKIKKCSRRV